MEKVIRLILPFSIKEAIVVSIISAFIITAYTVMASEQEKPLAEITCSLPAVDGYAVVRAHYRRLN